MCWMMVIPQCIPNPTCPSLLFPVEEASLGMPHGADAKPGAGTEPRIKHTGKWGTKRFPSFTCSMYFWGRPQLGIGTRCAGEQQGCIAASDGKSCLCHSVTLQWENYQSAPLTCKVAVAGKACACAQTIPGAPLGREGATGFMSSVQGRQSRSLTSPMTCSGACFCKRV